MPVSLQDILKLRQQEEFVGREEQLAFFRRNLSLAPENPNRRFIVNVFGQGGVGKTWLLRRFRQIAEEFGAVTACTDEAESDIPAVMGRIAEQFEAQGYELKSFPERYKVYRQRKKEIEADPEVPQGFPDLVGRTLTKSGLGALRGLGPVGGVVAGAVDEKAFADLGGEFASYVARKIKNKDEVRLVLEPVEVLTSVFLADLQNVAKERTIALFFDTYERTAEFLDPWLRDLLEGRHGDVPADIVLTIAGRDGLDRNHWSPYEGALARFPLDLFTDKETRNYLARKGITDESVIDVILSLSGRLPLLVATLAAERPSDPIEVGDPSGEAVERFLSWVDEPERRQVALNAALPRRLNRDVLAVLTGEERAQSLFVWLKGMPFVEKRGGAWVYHEVVRNQLLRYKRQESPQDWAELHRQLMGYYKELPLGSWKTKETSSRHEDEPRHSLEALYHQLMVNEDKAVESLKQFFKEAERRRQYNICEAMVAFFENYPLKKVNEGWVRFLRGRSLYNRGEWRKALAAYADIFGDVSLPLELRANALSRAGRLYYYQGNLDVAIKLYEESLKLNPVGYEVGIGRTHYILGEAYRVRGEWKKANKHYKAGLRVFEETGDQYWVGWSLTGLGNTYRMQGNWNKAEGTLKHALDIFRPLSESGGVAIVMFRLGWVYQLSGKWEEAMRSYKRSLEILEMQGDEYYVGRLLNHMGDVHLLRGKLEEARKFYEKSLSMLQALGTDIGLSITWDSKGMLHFVEKEWEQARACFETSLEKKDVTGYKFGVAWSLLNKGDLNRKQKRWNSALECYDQSLCIAREIGSRYIEAKGLVALCSVAHFKEAPLEELAAEAEAIATQHEYYDQLAELRYLQAGVYLKQMRQQKAFATYADSCVCALLYNVYFLDKIVKQIVQEVNSLRQHSQCEECRALVEYLILYWQNGSVEGNLLEEVERAKRLQEDHGKQQLSLVERLQDVLVEVKGN